MQHKFLRRSVATAAVGAVTAGTLFALAGPAAADPTTTNFTNACRATAAINVSKSAASGVTVNAPASVAPGEEFTYTMQVAPSSYPNSDSGATTTNVTRLKWDFEIPENVEFVSATNVGKGINLDGVAPSVIRINDAGLADPTGSFLRLSGNNQVIGNGADNNTKSEGGIRAPKLKKNLDGSGTSGDSHFQAPLVSVTVKAGDAGEVIQPKVRTTGAAGTWNNDRNWNTFLPKASFFGTQWAPTRCAPMNNKDGGPLNTGAGPLATINIEAAQVDVATATSVTGATAVKTGATSTYAAVITPAEATGTLRLTVDGTPVGTPVAVTAGQTTYTLPNTFAAEGTFQVRTVFTADTGYTSSTSTPLQVTATNAAVPDAQTTITVTEPDSAEVGVGVNLSAKISPVPAGGTVQFKDGGADIGSPVAVDSSGSATLSLHDFTTAGPHAITAVYSGTPGFEPSTSAVRTVTVTETVVAEVQTDTVVIVSPSAIAGQAVTLKAIVAPANANGTVQFKVSGVDVGQPVQVDENGVATLVHTFATAGTFEVTAEFSGADGFRDSSAAVSTVNVTGGAGGDGDDGATGSLGSAGGLHPIFGSLGG